MPRVSRPPPTAGLSATPFPLVRDEACVQPTWPIRTPAEIPAESFHVREGVFRTDSSPLTHLCHTSYTPSVTSVTPLPHPESPDRIFRMRQETLWFTESFSGKYKDVLTLSSRKFRRRFPPSRTVQKACAYGSLVESRSSFWMPRSGSPDATSPGAFTRVPGPA